MIFVEDDDVTETVDRLLAKESIVWWAVGVVGGRGKSGVIVEESESGFVVWSVEG